MNFYRKTKFKENFFDIADATAKQTFISDKDTIIDLFHLYWFAYLTTKKCFPKARKLQKFLGSIGSTRIQNIDENNELSALIKYAYDLKLINDSRIHLITKFLFIFKTKKDMLIDESLIRKWFDGTQIALPKNIHLKKARNDFVAGATLLDVFPGILKYHKSIRKNLSQTESSKLFDYFLYYINLHKTKGLLAQHVTPDTSTATNTVSDIINKDNEKDNAHNQKKAISNKINIAQLNLNINNIQAVGVRKEDGILQDRNYILAVMLVDEDLRGKIDSSAFTTIQDTVSYMDDEFDELMQLNLANLKISTKRLNEFYYFVFTSYVYAGEFDRISKYWNIFSKFINLVKLKSTSEEYRLDKTLIHNCEKIFENGEDNLKNGVLELSLANASLYISVLKALVPHSILSEIDTNLPYFVTTFDSDERKAWEGYTDKFQQIMDTYLSVSTVKALCDKTVEEVPYTRFSELTQANGDYLPPVLKTYMLTQYILIKNQKPNKNSGGGFYGYLSKFQKDLVDIKKLSDEDLIADFSFYFPGVSTSSYSAVYEKLKGIQKSELFLSFLLENKGNYSGILNYLTDKVWEDEKFIPEAENKLKEDKEWKEKISKYLSLNYSPRNNDGIEYSLPRDFNAKTSAKIKYLLDFYSREDKLATIKNWFSRRYGSTAVITFYAIYNTVLDFSIDRCFELFLRTNEYMLKQDRVEGGSSEFDYLTPSQIQILTKYFDYVIEKNWLETKSIDSNLTDAFKKYIPTYQDYILSLRDKLILELKSTTTPIKNSQGYKLAFPYIWVKLNLKTLIDEIGWIKLIEIFPFTYRSITSLLSYAIKNDLIQDVISKYSQDHFQIARSTLINYCVRDGMFLTSVSKINKDILFNWGVTEGVHNVFDEYLEKLVEIYNQTQDKEIVNYIHDILENETYLKRIMKRLNTEDDIEEFAEVIRIFIQEKDKRINKIMDYIQTINDPLFKRLVYFQKKLSASSNMFNEIIFSKDNVLPMVDNNVTRGQVAHFFKVNDSALDVSLRGGKRWKKGMPFLEYISELTDSFEQKAKSMKDKIPAPKVTPVEKTEEELEDTSVDINIKYNTQKHGNVALKILKEWDYVTSPEQLIELEKFKKAHPKTEILTPCFHSCGTLAANMVLRYWFSLSKKVEKVAKGLGSGIYFAPIIEKSLQYLGDSGMSRSAGTKGYVLDCTLTLGDWDTNYRDASGTGWVSAEYVIRDPWAQVKIDKVYYAEIITMPEFKSQLKKRGISEKIRTGKDRVITKKEQGIK